MEKLDEVPLPVLSLQVRRLLQSVTNRDQPKVRQLLRLGVAGLVNLTESSDGRSALHAAAANNLTDMVHFLLSQVTLTLISLQPAREQPVTSL